MIILFALLLSLALNCQKQAENFTDLEQQNLIHFIDSIHLRNNAMSLLHEVPSNSIENAFSPDNLEKINKALAMMKKGVKESIKVNDQTLDKLHPDLSKHYREELCVALESYISFLEEGGVAKESKSKKLSDKWGKWFFKEFDEMTERNK